jgi:hypothetical protein
MKKIALILLAAAVAVAVAAPVADAQCGCCGRRGPAWGPGPQGGRGPGAGFGPGYAQGRGWQRGGPMYDPDSVTTLTGKVTAVEIEPSGPGRAGGLHVTVQSDGKPTVVHLGPTWFLEQQKFVAAKDDTLAVTGSLVTSGEETFLIAREVKKGEKALTLRNEDGIPAWSRGRRWQ